jgi:tetratricopeptide (TPR) repeat protein
VIWVSRWTLRLAYACCFVALIVALPGSSVAQEASDEKRAAELFEKGADYFLQDEYEKALDAFERAYDHHANPMILFNAAVAHARLGDYESALDVARRAQQSELPEQAATKNRARIAAWDRMLRSRVRAGRIDEHAGRTRGPTGGPDGVQTPPESIPPQPSRGLSAVGWSGIGFSTVGLGLLGYTTYVEWSLEQDIEEYREAANENYSGRFSEKRETIRERQGRGRIALYAGLGAAAVGTGLLVWEWTSSSGREPGVRLHGRIGPRRVGFQLQVLPSR